MSQEFNCTTYVGLWVFQGEEQLEEFVEEWGRSGDEHCHYDLRYFCESLKNIARTGFEV